MFRNAVFRKALAAFRAACAIQPRRTQVERTLDLLNDITRFAFPAHVWNAYGRTDTPAETNYRLVSIAEHQQNGLHTAPGEIPVEIFRHMQTAFRRAGIMPNRHEGEMTLTSHSVHDLRNARPRLDGVTLEWLSIAAPALKRDMTATARQNWQFSGAYAPVAAVK